MKRICLLFLFIFLYSCSNYKEIELFRTGSKEEAINNIIVDFFNTERLGKNKSFDILELKESEDLYSYTIFESPIIYIDSRSILDSTSAIFPSKFKEVDGRIYIWRDSTQVINRKTIEKFDDYNVIDSTIYKIEHGILDESKNPILSNKGKEKFVVYFVCKKQISRFLKVKSRYLKLVNEYPTIDCN